MDLNWDPFLVVPRDCKADLPRSLGTLDGVGDRLRTAAFAEIQAREAFLWAADQYLDASPELKQAWRNLSVEENRHMGWLLKRMDELEIPVQSRRVSDQLWVSLTSCNTARDFAIYMASAEERGRKAGLRFHEELRKSDLITATLFGKIAEE